MAQTYQPPTQARIEAFTAAIVLWLVALAGIVFSPSPFPARQRLRHAIKRAERCVESVIFLMAARLCMRLPDRTLNYVRRSAPPGFRRRYKRSRLLFKRARVHLRGGGAYRRIARLIAVLANPARYVGRVFKLLNTKGLRGSRLLASYPPAHALGADAPATSGFANSS
jgi:hypothetical protein